MNARQEKFCSEYIRTGNASKAYMAAGYQPKNANAAAASAARMLKDVNVSSRIRELVAEMQEEKILDAKARRVILSEIAKGEDVAAAIRAIDILNKMDGEYIRKPQNDSIRWFEFDLPFDNL